MSTNDDWTHNLEAARDHLAALEHIQTWLAERHDRAAAEIAKYLRAEGGIDLDLDAIRATCTRPYTLIPINETEARLVHWRGVKLPIFGWVERQEPAFTVARVSRTMDLLTPLPGWMKQEMGWTPPAHRAVLDSSRSHVLLAEGDEATFKKRYGQFIGSKDDTGAFKLKGGDAWIRLVSQLIRDGILPYSPQPVASEHWDAKAASPIQLRDYQVPFVEQFRQKGALLINLPPGAGKTFITLDILNHFRGRALLLADTVIATEQWQAFVKEYAPAATVTISTYQGAARYAQSEFDLVVFDEAHRVPANTFSKLAFIQTQYRLGLTGTPWREDDRQHLIVALAGFPAAIRWAELIRAGVLKRPRVIVSTVASDPAKTNYIRQLLARRRPGKALIFCDWLEAGQALANALQVPFVSGESAHKLQQVRDAEVSVVSRIADTSLDFPDLTLVVEYAFMGGSRTQEAQRLGRLLHGQQKGEHYLLFTPEEAARYRNRLLGVESELLGEVDIEYETVGQVAEPKEREVKVKASKPRPAAAKAPSQPQSEVDVALASPAVAKLIAQAESKIGVKASGYVAKALRLAWDSPVSLDELRLGRGIGEEGMKRYRAGFREAVAAGLIEDLGGQRYLTNRVKLKKLIELAEKYKR